MIKADPREYTHKQNWSCGETSGNQVSLVAEASAQSAFRGKTAYGKGFVFTSVLCTDGSRALSLPNGE